MAEEPTNIVLEHLRRIDRKVDKIGDDLTELKTRMIARLDRIERRLELSDG